MLAAWREADVWRVGRYVLMADHVHLFCAPADAEVSLERWMRFWKSRLSRSLILPGMDCRWQAQHWDRRLRRQERYGEKWEYVRQNPVRAGLAKQAEEWPFQGEMHFLPW